MEKVKMTLVLPDLNRFKSYKSKERTFELLIDDVSTFKVDQDDGQVFDVDVPMGALIQIVKRFRNKPADSVFAYRLGEKTAMLRDQNGKFKECFPSLDGDVLFVYDDNDFKFIDSLEGTLALN